MVIPDSHLGKARVVTPSKSPSAVIVDEDARSVNVMQCVSTSFFASALQELLNHGGSI